MDSNENGEEGGGGGGGGAFNTMGVYTVNYNMSGNMNF